MTSRLRLSKDRSFLFRRQPQDIHEDSSSANLAHRLPDISLVDTRSFADLFDQFKHQGPLEDSSNPQPGIDYETPSEGRAKPPSIKININRNDSTSSCYSQPSQRESEYSPVVTRHSSSSSYNQEPPFTVPKSGGGRTAARAILADTIGSYSSAHGSSSTTQSSSLMVFSARPNLDKPLPPGPSEQQNGSTSAPDLPIRETPAELPSEPLLPVKPQSAPSLAQGTPSQVEDVAGSQQALGVEGRPERPSVSTAPRPIQTSNGSAHSHRRHKSASAMIMNQSLSSGIEQAGRSSADLSRLNSKVRSTSRPAKSRREQLHKPITAATAERVIYRIMCNLYSIQDLQATAMVSKGFLRTFQRNESNLVSHLIFKTSKPAWELRRSLLALEGSNRFALKDFRRDCNTLAALKVHLAAHCSSSCKPSTVAGLLGQDRRRQAEIDDALWRIWTFCTLFGNTAGQSGVAKTEIDWLNGSRAAPDNKQLGAWFAVGNGQGVSTRELENMNELWQCLQGLMSGFRGREEEAKQYGVFDNWHPDGTTSESQHLEEWNSYLLALGPQTILGVSSCSFERARMLGLTKWPAPAEGKSRSSFLTAAMTQVYQERVLEEATSKATRFAVSRGPVHRPTRSVEERRLPSGPSSQPRSLRIDTSQARQRPVSVDAVGNSRLEIRPDCDPACRPGRASSHMFPASPTADPTLFYALNMTSTASTKLGATLFPMDYASPTWRVPFPAPERPAAPRREVVDPVDKAMTFLVHEMGFEESRARKALAMCECGSGIDLQKAVELLAVDSKSSRRQFSSPVELPTPVEISGSNKLPKTYCDGQCKRAGTIVHSRSQSAGAMTDVSISPVSATDDSEWQDTISPLVASPTSATQPRTSKRRGQSRSSKTWKVLGMDTMLKRKNSVLGIDEYQAKVERRKSMRALNGTLDPRVKHAFNKDPLDLR